MLLNDDAQQILSQRFKIKRLLGKGSFGNVYECEQKKNGQIYAIKMIAKNNAKKSRIQCMRQEATLLQSLDHPNIVKVYQFFEDERVVFIKMEYVKSGTLGQLIKQRQSKKSPFSDQEAAQIMKGIFNAVNYIHSLSILHRDIKPQNILLDNKQELDKLKIADFGLGAKLQFHSPTAISKCGTYLYMAPEIMWNYTYTKAVDVWSCAIIMYMLKKGCHPFYESGMTHQQFKQKIKNIEFPPLEDLNPQNNDIPKGKKKQSQSIVVTKKKSLLCQDLMSRISKLLPNERYTAQDAIKHPWITRNFQDEIPLSLHDSFHGFQTSHQISLMMKTFLTLKNVYYKKEIYEKVRKNDIFERYLGHCEQVNRKDRSVSPLKVRRLSSINNTRQTSQLCQLSSLVISPKKSKQIKKAPIQINDPTNPTIAKLNLIFNNLFDKKQKKSKRQINLVNGKVLISLNQNQEMDRNFQYKEVPDISAYKILIETQLQAFVKERNKRKKQQILPSRKKNQFGELIGRSCEVRKSFVQKTPKKQDISLNIDQISLNNSQVSNRSISISGKIRMRRKLNNNSAFKNYLSNQAGKYIT